MKSIILFAVCFLVGAITATAVRSALHRPYADATAAHAMAPPPATAPATATAAPDAHQGHGAAAPSPGATGHEGHAPARPAPQTPPTAPHSGHAAPPPAGQPATPPAPAATPSPSPAAPDRPAHQHGATGSAAPAAGNAVLNTMCPSCGMDVDPEIKPIPTSQGLVGVGCAPCVPKIMRDPERFGAAARENRRAR